MKFVIDIPGKPVKCDLCPCSSIWGKNTYCELAQDSVLGAYIPTEFSPFGRRFHPRPDWCPLVSLDEMEQEK